MKFGGHIGYGIRPSERKKGYAKIQLYLALMKANEMNLERVMIDCDETNIASDRTIIALGGKFDRIEHEEDKNLKVYWIDVKKSLEDNKKYIENV